MYKFKKMSGIFNLPKRNLFHQLRFFKNARISPTYYIHSDSDVNGIDESEEISNSMHCTEVTHIQSTRHLFNQNSTNTLIIKLNQCASVQEVFDTLRDNSYQLEFDHLAQAVFVLWDLHKIFLYAYDINKTFKESDNTIHNFKIQLVNHPEFEKLLGNIGSKCNDFSSEYKSCLLLYLNKLGVSLQHPTMQQLLKTLQEELNEKTTLSTLSRFIVTAFTENNLTSFLITQEAIPIVIKKLESCKIIEDFKLITICLNHLQPMVTSSVLELYIKKLNRFLENGDITYSNYGIFLKIIGFLSYPRWNHQNTNLISKIMLLFKDNLHLLNILQFSILYEILYKNQEPGDILTDVQRYASRLLHSLQEDDSNIPSEIKFKLLSATISFTVPMNRPDYEKIFQKYIEEPLNLYSIFDALRILVFLKPSNFKVCDLFWSNAIKAIEANNYLNDIDYTLKLCQKYMNYNNDVHYRHGKFEKILLDKLELEFENGIAFLIPSKLSIAGSFIFVYGKKEYFINNVVKKISDNWEQFKHVDCLYISKALRNNFESSKNRLSDAHVTAINAALNKCISEKLIKADDSTKINFLLKSCIYRKVSDSNLINQLLLNLKEDQHLSSNLIRNTVFNLQSTNALLPNLIDHMVNYVVQYGDNLLGFNAGKVAYLCYYLGYLPANIDEFFKSVTNILLRDQERISGLSYIQVAIALCFFNKLSKSFIKHIFNTQFLEKLDSELNNCYFRDTYPVRVRNSMMKLNRAVCLDYPESNVPWFHQKYIEQLLKKSKVSKEQINNTFKIKTYLNEIVGDHNNILENSITAYGYHIDFLLQIDNEGNFIEPNSNEKGTKIAVILANTNAYTVINIQLKGEHQLKQRHLEILGYKVLILNMDEWNNTVYSQEKIEYLIKLMTPGNMCLKTHAIQR